MAKDTRPLITIFGYLSIHIIYFDSAILKMFDAYLDPGKVLIISIGGKEAHFCEEQCANDKGSLLV